MIVIDGSAGEGGGQVVRTSLTLAMCTASPTIIRNIRARRSNPGLRAQHLAAVHAAAAICGARVEGATMDEIAGRTVRRLSAAEIVEHAAHGDVDCQATLSRFHAVEEALGRMRARGVRRAPVTSAHGMLVGVISTDDLIAQLARELRALTCSTFSGYARVCDHTLPDRRLKPRDRNRLRISWMGRAPC